MRVGASNTDMLFGVEPQAFSQMALCLLIVRALDRDHADMALCLLVFTALDRDHTHPSERLSPARLNVHLLINRQALIQLLVCSGVIVLIVGNDS